MNRTYHWLLVAALISPFLFFPRCPVYAATNSISVTLTLDSLPQTITLCRDSNAIKSFGIDEEWDAFVNVDSNNATGLEGFDVDMAIKTLSQTYPCTPTSASTEQSLTASISAWDASQNLFVPMGQIATVRADFAARTLTITTDVTGALANLSSTSTIEVQSAATYTPAGTTTPTFAVDVANTIGMSASATDASNDVNSCSAPCGTGASWYPLVDLVGVSVSTALPLPAAPPAPPPAPPYGANTVDVEFDLASLPAKVTLCSSPNFHTASGYDIMWVAGSNYDASLGAYLTLIAVHTPLQNECASPTSAALATSLRASVFQLDPNNFQNGYFNVDSAASVSLDAADNKIVVQVNDIDPSFSTLSTSSFEGFTVENVTSSAQGDFSSTALSSAFLSDYPQDDASPFTFGSSFVDPSNDVCTASGCNSASYPVIDLIGGSAHRDDYIFRNGFE